MFKLLLSLAFVIPATCFGQQATMSRPATEAAPSPTSPTQFLKDARVAFIGDSITHGGGYHNNIVLFYATRFPNRPFQVFNCGVSGDTTPGTNARFETDIAVHHPTDATIMLGMNDAWGWCFEDDPPTEKQIAGRANAVASYQKSMTQLVASLMDQNCRVTLIKPTIYDQTAQLPVKNLVGKNDQLERFAKFLDTLAAKHGLPVVDFFTPMVHVNARLQATDSTATIIGKDRVHPGEAGHLMMAYAFLKSQQMPTYVSRIEIDAAKSSVTRTVNCELNLEAPLIDKDSNISFACTEQALPFPVGNAQRPALDWIPFQQQLNQQVLQVTGLDDGSYELSIDDSKVGKWTSKELAAGIGLSENTATPQYQQALRVKAINDARAKVVGKLRAIALVRHTMVSKLDPPVSEDDLATLKIALAAHVEKSKGKSWYYYVRDQSKMYLESLPRMDEFQQQARDLEVKLWQAARPTSHQWSLKRTGD